MVFHRGRRPFALLSMMLLTSVCAPRGWADAPEPAKSGEYETTLKDRSPLSAPAEIARRFGAPASETSSDYDLAQMPVTFYVPAAYKAAAPAGLLVFLNNQGTDAFPAALKPIIDEKNLIGVSIKNPALAPWQKAGLLLDIAAGAQAKYAIDKKRIYLIDVEENNFVPLAVADVYTGFISTLKWVHNGPVMAAWHGHVVPFTPHDPHKMQPKLVSQAKRDAFVFVYDPKTQETLPEPIRASNPAVPATMLREGYQHVKVIKTPPGDAQFPDYKGQWLSDAIVWMDAMVGSSKPAAGGAGDAAAAPSAPADAASEEAARLLKLAKVYIQANRTKVAREKLNEIIEKYPNDPSAVKARELLGQMGD